MTVRDLIEELKGFPQNQEVLLARDEEGNEFYRVATVEHEWYIETRADSFEQAVVIWP